MTLKKNLTALLKKRATEKREASNHQEIHEYDKELEKFTYRLLDKHINGLIGTLPEILKKKAKLGDTSWKSETYTLLGLIDTYKISCNNHGYYDGDLDFLKCIKNLKSFCKKNGLHLEFYLLASEIFDTLGLSFTISWAENQDDHD